MAVYKVPQDVEAEDKLLGPLTFRQFIYLMIAAASAALAFFMFQVFPFLAIIPMPVILVFGILALPLRKDQPMETYILALLRFYLKPKQRMWNPDGTITYVEITAPKLVEERLSKDYSGETAKERLDYLARVMDSRGWALKGIAEQQLSANLSDTVVAEAEHAVDVLDEHASVSKSFETLIAQQDQQRRKTVMEQMQKSAAEPRPTVPAQRQAPAAAPKQAPATASDDGITAPHFNPYPNAIHQKVVLTMDQQAAAAQQAAKTATQNDTTTAMTPPVSPGIIRLASNDDLSISALAHEAHRLEDKNDEVVIQLH